MVLPMKETFVFPPHIKDEKTGKSPHITHTYQILVWLFLKNPRNPSTDWANEIKTSKKLLKKYPDIRFWSSIDLGFRLNSLLFFISEEGKRLLKIEWQKFKFVSPPKTVYNLEDEKLGDDANIQNNKKSTIDWIKI